MSTSAAGRSVDPQRQLSFPASDATKEQSQLTDALASWRAYQDAAARAVTRRSDAGSKKADVADKIKAVLLKWGAIRDSMEQELRLAATRGDNLDQKVQELLARLQGEAEELLSHFGVPAGRQEDTKRLV